MTDTERERLIYEKMIEIKERIRSLREEDPELGEYVSFDLTGADEIADEAARRLMSEGLLDELLNVAQDPNAGSRTLKIAGDPVLKIVRDPDVDSTPE